MEGLIQLIELYTLVIVIDVLVGWVQPHPERWPRRALHLLTEPPQRALRAVVRPPWTGGVDVSPAVMIAILGLIRVWLATCCTG